MSNTALITGASSGIGLELARIHAEKGGDMILVARSEKRLNSLKEELESKHKVTVTVIAEDLSDPSSVERITTAVDRLGVAVDTLINNAGFGGHGRFHQRSIDTDNSMMQVNMVALTNLTHHFLKGMVERNRGQILNVSSTASFMPGPLQAVYYATKAYVTSFTQAIAEEVAEYGVTATALCPGTVDTGFVSAGDLDGLDAWKNAKSPRSVAECGYKAMEEGQLVAFNESALKFMLNWIIPLLPRKTILKMSRQFMEK